MLRKLRDCSLARKKKATRRPPSNHWRSFNEKTSIHVHRGGKTCTNNNSYTIPIFHYNRLRHSVAPLKAGMSASSKVAV